MLRTPTSFGHADRLVSADQAEKSGLFKETRDRTLTSKKDPLPNTAAPDAPLEREKGAFLTPKRIAYRSFDRQWLLPDNRVIDFARTDLWAAELRGGQLYLTEQHSQSVRSGPAVVISTLIPDMHHFNVRGGRVLPLLHPDGSANLAPGLLSCLTSVLGIPVTAPDMAAYIAGTVAHPAFTEEFTDELVTPGIRVPITTDPDLWEELVEVGSDLIWASTYGEAFSNPQAGRPKGAIVFATTDPRRPKNLTPLGEGLPDRIAYTEGKDGEGTLHVGRSSFGPVTPRMWAYDVGGMNVIRKWFSYRKANPGGKKTSPLDDIHLDTWPREWITELNELLTALRRVTELESEQEDLLDRVLSGPLITSERLATSGVRFPRTAKDRKPRYGLAIPGTKSSQGTIV